jgi:hypothetical protein
MRTTVELLDALKRRLSITSDYALAKEMGWSVSRLSNYTRGVSHLDTFGALQVADKLGESPLKIIAIVEAERTKRPEQRKRWQELAKASMFATALIGSGIFAAPSPSQASQSPTDVAKSVYYVKSRRRHFRYQNLPLDPLLAGHA